MAFGDLKDAASIAGASIFASNALTMGGVTVNVDDLVYVVIGEIGGLTATGVTDNRGNTYTALNAGNTSGTVNGRAFYSRVTNAGTLSTITLAATPSGNDFVLLAIVLEGPFGALDKNPANGVDSTSPFISPATGILAQANEAVIAWSVANYSTAWLASSPMILRVEELDFAKKGIIASKVVAATTSTTPEFTGALNPTNAIGGTSTFRKGSLTEIITVTQATVTVTGKTVTTADVLTVVSVGAASILFESGIAAVVNETPSSSVIAVEWNTVAFVGKPFSIVEAIPINKAAVTFTGRTVTSVTSAFEGIPKYIIRGRGSRHELWTQGFGGTIKGRSSRAFLVMR